MSLSFILSDDKPTQSDKSIIYGLRGFLIGEKGQFFQGENLTQQIMKQQRLSKEENVMSNALIISVYFGSALLGIAEFIL